MLAARYASALTGWNGGITDEFLRKLRSLRGLCRDIVGLRRGDHLGARLELERERLAGGCRLPVIFSRPPKAPEAPEPAAPDRHESNPVKPSQTNFFYAHPPAASPHHE